jgi:hypothetical protein
MPYCPPSVLSKVKENIAFEKSIFPKDKKKKKKVQKKKLILIKKKHSFSADEQITQITQNLILPSANF